MPLWVWMAIAGGYAMLLAAALLFNYGCHKNDREDWQ